MRAVPADGTDRKKGRPLRDAPRSVLRDQKVMAILMLPCLPVA